MIIKYTLLTRFGIRFAHNGCMTQIKTGKNSETPGRVVVVGTSAGGLQALKLLTSQFQQSFPVPILVVQHLSSPFAGEALLSVLAKSTALNCQIAENGTSILPGHLYLAPPDQHMMIGNDKKILLTKGAPENRARPSIDALFRSAAVNFSTGVIAVLLTGFLDDGTSGMKAVMKCGGTSIVQDPEEADYPDMPQNALNFVSIDHVVPLLEMGGLIYQLMVEKLKKSKSIPKDVVIESKIAERVLSDL